MNQLKWGPWTILGVLAVFAVGFGLGGGMRLIILAANEDLIILSALWIFVLAAAYFLWRAVRRFRSFDTEAISRRLVDQIEKDKARAAAEKAKASAMAKPKDDKKGPRPGTEEAADEEPSSDDESSPPAAEGGEASSVDDEGLDRRPKDGPTSSPPPDSTS